MERRISTRKVTKIARLVHLALLFVTPTDELGGSREAKPPGPPAAPHYCNLHGGDHSQLENCRTALGDSLTRVCRTRQAMYV